MYVCLVGVVPQVSQLLWNTLWERTIVASSYIVHYNKNLRKENAD